MAICPRKTVSVSSDSRFRSIVFGQYSADHVLKGIDAPLYEA